MYVSVVIPTYHDWRRLEACVRALEVQTLGRSEFEILLVNNDPGDNPPAWFVAPANAEILTESTRGSYAARNRAVREARGEVFAFTDSDCVPDPQWLEAGIQQLNLNPELARVCGPIELFFSGKRLTPAEAYENVKAFAQERNAAKGTALTANMFTRAQVFEYVGQFDESRTSGGDLEWGFRADIQGFSIAYEPRAKVQHPARRRLRDLKHKFRRVASKDYLDWSAVPPGYRYRRLVWELRPRVKAFRHFRRKSLSTTDAVVAFGVGWWLSWVRVGEVLRLLRGGVPRN